MASLLISGRISRCQIDLAVGPQESSASQHEFEVLAVIQGIPPPRASAPWHASLAEVARP
jgi:hypothetical protein